MNKLRLLLYLAVAVLVIGCDAASKDPNNENVKPPAPPPPPAAGGN